MNYVYKIQKKVKKYYKKNITKIIHINLFIYQIYYHKKKNKDHYKKFNNNMMILDKQMEMANNKIC